LFVEVRVRSVFVVIVVALIAGCQKTPAQSQNTGQAQSKQAQTKPAQGSSSPAAATQPTSGVPPAGQPPAGAQPAAPPPAKPVPAALPEVVARIDGKPVTKAEFERAIHNIEARAGRSVPAEQRNQVLRSVLDELIAFKLVLTEAQVRSIGVTDTEVDARLAEIKKQFPTEAAFQEALKQRQLNLADLKTETRTELIVNKTVEAEVAPKVVVGQPELDAFYKENPDQFKQPEQVRASHILFPIDASAAEDAKKKTRAEAESVLKRAQSGEDFAALAKQYSKDSSASNGGDLNFFPRGQMVPAFEQVAFTLDPGKISGLVESQFGIHIIKVTEKRPGRVVPLAEVSDRLTGFLKQQKQQQLAQAFLQSLRMKYKVEVLI